MSDPRRRRRRAPRVDPARLARIEELRIGVEQRIAYIRERFPHATSAHFHCVDFRRRPKLKPSGSPPPPRGPAP